MSKIDDLAKRIRKAKHAYYNKQPIMSDAAYDAIEAELKALDPANPVLSLVGADAVSEWQKIKHDIPMGSLDKVQTPEEFVSWCQDRIRAENIFWAEKLDGLSINLVYVDGKLSSGRTRGDGITGEEIIVNVRKMNGAVPTISDNFNGSVRGEIVLRRSNHKNHFPEYANPRNAASGIAKRLDGKGPEHLDIIVYQVIGDIEFKTEGDQFRWLKKQKFQVPNNGLVISAKEVLLVWKEYQAKIRDKLDYDIDGLVCRLNNLDKQQALGDKDMRPKGAVAFKFESEKKTTFLRDIIWQVGNSARITPVGVFDPVSIMGATIERASLYNASYVRQLGLDIGAEILIARANDVIPRIEECVVPTGTVAKPPKHCPACRTGTLTEGEYLVCPNDMCPAVVVGRIKGWIDTLNLLEWGDAIIEKLVETGRVKTIADLYRLKADDIATMDRMGEKSAQKLISILWENDEVTLEVFIGGLSIPMIGTSMVKMVTGAGYDTLDRIINMTQLQMENISGLGPAKAEALRRGLIKNRALIAQLLHNGVVIKDKIVGKLTGKSFCFSGKSTLKRSVLEQMVIDAGGDVKSSVGSGLGYLVLADPSSSSSKAESAKKHGTKILSEDDFVKFAK